MRGDGAAFRQGAGARNRQGAGARNRRGAFVSFALTPVTIALLGLCVFAEVAYQLSFKAAAGHADHGRYARTIVRQPLLWFGVGLWTAEIFGWILVLQRTPLAVAFPVMSLTCAFAPLASLVVFKQRMSRSQIAGAALVLIGVFSVSLARL